MAIYLDHAATTPLHPEVREGMLPFLNDQFGNPSSSHRFGRDVRNAVDRAREQIAQALNADPRRIVFTSGGTEADNLAIIGVATAYEGKGRHIVTSAIEHHAVLEACEHLESRGFHVTYVPVDCRGTVDPDDVERAMTDETVLVSIMYGNNEIGTLQPIAEIGERVRERGCRFHTDAVQAFGAVSIDLKGLPIDLLSVSGHKINGPKGIGALYIGPSIAMTPRQFGGSQEWKWRPGTENVPGIVGFGKAAAIAVDTLSERRKAYTSMRQAMLDVWERAGIDFVVNGHPTNYLPQILNVSFLGVDTEVMLMNLDLAGIACASGSACTAGSLQVSHVLKAMRLPEDVTASAVRFSFGYGNTVEEVQRAAKQVVEIVKRLKR